MLSKLLMQIFTKSKNKLNNRITSSVLCSSYLWSDGFGFRQEASNADKMLFLREKKRLEFKGFQTLRER